MDRNALLAIVLSGSFVLLVLYVMQPSVTDGQKSVPLVKNVEDVGDLGSGDEGAAVESAVKTVDQNILPVGNLRVSSLSRNKRSEHVLLNNGVFEITFTSIDAAVLSVKLLGYKDEHGEYIDAVFHKHTDINPLATSFVSAERLREKQKSIYQHAQYRYNTEKKQLKRINPGSLKAKSKDYENFLMQKITQLSRNYPRIEHDIQFLVFRSEYQNRAGKRFEFLKVFSLVEGGYLIHLHMRIQRLSTGDIEVHANEQESQRSFYIHWGRGLGPYFPEQSASSYDKTLSTSYLDLSGQHPEENLVETNMADIRDFQWVSLDSRYLVVGLIAPWSVHDRAQKFWDQKGYFGEIYQGELVESSGFFSGGLVKKSVGEEIIGIGFQNFVLNDSQPSRSFDLALFIGAKSRSLLDQDRYKDFQLSVVRDRTWIPLIKPLEWAIEWFLFQTYTFTQNFGVSIILLTLVLKILLNPLTKRSLESSTKMAQFAPKMKEIEKQYKNKPEQKQKAIMELYKREKINPLSGCLPLLLQAPVFYALWSVFPSLLDLKNASFLWIQDLSSPDTVAEMNLFFTDKLNVLPLIMSATFIVQSKITPQASSGMGGNAQSAEMMKYILPGIFLFVFWSMPSGLVLYWTVQNILQIGQQFYIKWKSQKKGEKNACTRV